MNDILCLAGKSDNFTNFLTVSRKFNFTCVYIFHTSYQTRSNWQMILSHTKIFNIFLGSLQTSSVIKILSSYCHRYTCKYFPHMDLWVNQLYFQISNSSKKQRLINFFLVPRNNLSPFKNVFQYVYSNVNFEVYCATERRRFNLKSTFHIVFKSYNNKRR